MTKQLAFSPYVLVKDNIIFLIISLHNLPCLLGKLIGDWAPSHEVIIGKIKANRFIKDSSDLNITDVEPFCESNQCIGNLKHIPVLGNYKRY